MTQVETRTIDSIDIDSRVRERIPFDEGDTVKLVTKEAGFDAIRSRDQMDSLTGKLHSDDETFAFSEGIRDGRMTLK
jgi:hypothetical protein